MVIRHLSKMSLTDDEHAELRTDTCASAGVDHRGSGGSPSQGVTSIGYFDDGRIHAGYITMPVIPGDAGWVCIGRRLALYPGRVSPQ